MAHSPQTQPLPLHRCSRRSPNREAVHLPEARAPAARTRARTLPMSDCVALSGAAVQLARFDRALAAADTARAAACPALSWCGTWHAPKPRCPQRFRNHFTSRRSRRSHADEATCICQRLERCEQAAANRPVKHKATCAAARSSETFVSESGPSDKGGTRTGRCNVQREREGWNRVS